MEISKVWAKTEPYQPIRTHGIVSGLIAQFLLNEYICAGTKRQLSEELELNDTQLIAFIGYFVSLHDIGKISEKFQSKQHNAYDLTRHEKTSQQAVMRLLCDKYNIDRRSARLLSEILGAHHQGKPGRAEENNNEWIQLQNEFEEKMSEYFFKGSPSIPAGLGHKENQGVFEAILLGLTVFSDWLASSRMFAEAETWSECKCLEENISKSMTVLVHELSLENNYEFGDLFCNVWPNIPEEGIRETQKICEDIFHDQGKIQLLLIEAPMGEGKTEAGVYAAVQMAKQWGKNGFYIGLPTTATSNQMVTRTRKLFEMHQENTNVRLLHGSLWLSERSVPEFDNEDQKYIYQWLQPSRMGLLGSYAVGTVDQVMMAAMRIKYGILRLLGLAQKVLIIDEIHAYDMYMMNIISGLLIWCKALQIPVVLMTATLPPERKKELINIYSEQEMQTEYPSVTCVDENGKVNVYKIENVAKRSVFELQLCNVLHKPNEIAELALEKINDGGCCCVILNTVKQAQEVYEQLKFINQDAELILFHSQFTEKRRKEIENECLTKFSSHSENRPAKAVLVATQVVEQSLDIDFDVMLSAIAPIDLLLQRMGREFRHADVRRPASITKPVFTVLLPGDNDYSPDSYIYDECLLKQTEFILKGRQTISIPEDINQLVTDGYDLNKVPEVQRQNWLNYMEKLKTEESSSDQYKLSDPTKKLSPLYQESNFDDLEQDSYFSARTRLAEPSVRICILPEEEFAALAKKYPDRRADIKNHTEAKELWERSVSVSKNKVIRRIPDTEVITGGMLLEGVMVISDANDRIKYNDELGVIWREYE